MKKRTLIVVLSAALIVSLIGLAASAYWIYSNTVSVNVTQGSVALSASNVGLEVSLTATGLKNGVTVQFGTTSSSSPAGDSDFSFIGSASADGTGTAVLTWTAPSTGQYYFSARAYNTDVA